MNLILGVIIGVGGTYYYQNFQYVNAYFTAAIGWVKSKF